ncbi:hypothetical protein [Serratia sp. DD3]|uniref:hypothetical protein n=1 Tax=Serratia sp. DD3 TaxID=1410619 RepID=UPI0003C4FD7F|nr:hypothetical protein [Serratia sp. DD3]KEY56951.1 hypothetical protein SRDD_42000 [Serratia sp. DD3]
MARIRTVKPELWTDEKVAECSIAARLLFIGMFNFADDNGNLVNSPKRIKMQIFPADSMDCEPLIAELMTHGLLTEYSVSEASYLNIKGFNKHQKINRPSKTTIPRPRLTEHSVSDHGAFTGGKDPEGKGEDQDINYHSQPAGVTCCEPDFPVEAMNLPTEAIVHPISGRYAFEGQVIRLNHKDFNAWAQLYPLIDLNYELQKLDIEFSHQKPKNWFITASQKLSYQNKQLKQRGRAKQVVNAEPVPHWNSKESWEEFL